MIKLKSTYKYDFKYTYYILYLLSMLLELIILSNDILKLIVSSITQFIYKVGNSTQASKNQNITFRNPGYATVIGLISYFFVLSSLKRHFVLSDIGIQIWKIFGWKHKYLKFFFFFWKHIIVEIKFYWNLWDWKMLNWKNWKKTFCDIGKYIILYINIFIVQLCICNKINKPTINNFHNKVRYKAI